ncbi:hypothetical protein BC833DRAFT_515355, partial [Globomyces pollinis-pini]
ISTISIAIYNSFELLLVIYQSFKIRTTLYYRSLIVTSTGIILFSVGFLILFNDLISNVWIPLITLTIGWHSMVTGFAVVMYSRIHLVCMNSHIIQGCKYMIIFNYVVCHIPTTILTFGANLIGTPVWIQAYAIYEAFQITMFFIQEVILGIVYLVYIKETLGHIPKKDADQLILHTTYIQLFVILLDLIMIATEYAGLYNYQIATKALLYCIKLKLEFSILNLL